jgi:4-amino-4-deoxy-L-arabinose transferase-like glycosyltransferase/endo-1,4-beta-D-glucanase Y
MNIKTLTSNIQTKLIQFGVTELVLTIIAFVIVAYSHSKNLFHFPYYENDEGTYMAQAWAVTDNNKLAQYTYWYDHAPFGWMFLGFFVKLIGGYNVFGNAINTGRVIMFIMHMLTCVVIYISIYKITKNKYASIISILFFSMFPVANLFQRRVLLDNILVFFLAISVLLILNKKVKIINLMLSGAILGLSVLSKESAVFFLPGIMYLLYYRLDKGKRLIGYSIWLGFFSAIISIYLILAILKTELFPSSNKVSLIGTLLFHSGRGTGKYFWEKHSDFYSILPDLTNLDYFSFYFLVSFTFFSILYTFIKFRNHYWNTFMIFLMSYMYFMLRGKIVLPFYVIPLFYILTLLFGIFFNDLYLFIKSKSLKYKQFKVLFVIASMLFLSFNQLFIKTEALNSDKTTLYEKSVNWIRTNLKQEDRIIIDCGVYPQLHFPASKLPTFPNADWYWKAEHDKEIKESKLKNNIENVDYIFATFQYILDVENGGMKFNRSIYDESKKVIDYSSEKLTSQIFKVVKNKPQIIKDSWENYKKQFVINGKVSDKNQKDSSTQQIIALMLSYAMNDSATFDQIWLWIKNNLIINTEYDIRDNSTVQYKTENISIYQDLALGLHLASIRFNVPEYNKVSQTLISKIWKENVYQNQSGQTIYSREYSPGKLLINPSNFSPVHYSYFAKIDISNDWESLKKNSYAKLNQILKTKTFVPNKILYNIANNQFETITNLDDNTSDNYGYDSYKLLWKVLLDKTSTSEKEKFVENQKKLFEELFNKNGMISVSYRQDKTIVEDYESTATDSPIMLLFDRTNSDFKGRFWREKFIERVDLDTNLFDPKNNIQNQSWGLFEMAIRYNFFELP